MLSSRFKSYFCSVATEISLTFHLKINTPMRISMAFAEKEHIPAALQVGSAAGVESRK